MKKLSLLTLVFVLFILTSGASAKVTYTVKKGDNLYDIAKKFHVSTKDLEKANKVGAKNLKPGTKLVIPGKNSRIEKANKKSVQESAEPAVSSKPLAGKTAAIRTTDAQTLKAEDKGAAETTKTSSDSGKYHTVRKGDTLKGIARKYSVSASDIKALNGLKSAKLRTGQKLMVRQAGPRTYAVRKGDTLTKIAKKFDMDADDLMEINELPSPSLKVGQKLYLDEKQDVVNVDQKYLIMANNIEAEIKKVSESADFAEMTTQDKLVVFARKLLNIPYKFGGNTILGIDCSAYVKKVYGLLGVELPRTAREQFNEGQQIAKEELSIGDLVFFKTYASFPSHVGIYLGNNLFIHASSKGKKVTINSLDTPYYFKRFIGAKRLISGAGENDLASADPSS
ncbi:MAG: LysM peptidoglycan-binding domain-containing protein [Nitrospirae bacterium]|nr:LysM peptidoglycan-binding domain-containing protein [Nitrospirota bacterium]